MPIEELAMFILLPVLLLIPTQHPAAETPLCWAYAREFPDPGITVPQNADYVLWAWGKADTDVTVTLDGQSLSIHIPPADPKANEASGNTAWGVSETIRLKAGKTDIRPGPGIYALALTAPGAPSPADAVRATRVTARPEAVSDARVIQRRHTDTVYTMPLYNRESWEAAAATIRRRMLIACGLANGWQEATSPNVARERIAEYDDYIVEKIRFEVFPGFWGTGNLYLPSRGEGPWPAILNPHGHWSKGRLEHSDSCSVPARCITFARMGAIALSIDMIGYNDSCQFKTHRWSSEEEKLWGIHPFALQLMTSLRAVDVLRHLPEANPERIGCTGASGGGTQTFALYTVDDRVRVAAPVNMISSTMQGGCVCENAPLIRLGHSNMEIGAMMAPRPLLMVAATGDWTRETPRVEYPAIRSVYELYGARDNVESIQFDYGHNYNQDSRNAVYRFFGKHLIDPQRDWSSFQETSCEPEPKNRLRLFPDGKPPADWPDGRTLIKQLTETRKRETMMRLSEKHSAENIKTRWQEAFRDIFAGAREPDINTLITERTERTASPEYIVERWLIGRSGAGDRIPVMLFYQDPPEPRDIFILVDDQDKRSFLEPSGRPGPLVNAALGAGKAVMLVDPFLTGEFHAPDAVAARQTVGVFLDTFEPTDTACRVQDILTAVAFARSRRDMTEQVSLAGWGLAGLWVLFAAALDENINRVAADLRGFPLNDDNAWASLCYAPSLRYMGDIHMAAALTGERAILLAGWNGDVRPAAQFAGAINTEQVDSLLLLKSLMDTKNTP